MHLIIPIGILAAISILGFVALALYQVGPHPAPVDDSAQTPKTANGSDLPASSGLGTGPKSPKKPEEDLSHLLGSNHFLRWLNFGPLDERLEYFRSLPVGSKNDYGGAARELIKDLYPVSPEDAIQLVVEKKGLGDFWAASMQLGEFLGKAGDLDKLTELSTTEGGKVITSGYLEGFATVNPEEALALSAVFSTTGVDPSGAIISAAASAGKFQEAIAAIRKFNLPAKDLSIQSVYTTWVKFASVDAANHLIRQAATPSREVFLGHVLSEWESWDPDGYEKWLGSVKDSPAAEVVEEALRKAGQD
jgi:hypothetical protein